MTTAALRAEWIKLRTVRSTTWSLLALVGVSVLFTAIATSESHTEGGRPGAPVDNDIVLNSLTGLWFGQIAAAVLAVLAITSEYSTRMIRTTFAAMPRRRMLLGAKAALAGVVVFVVGLGASVACFLIGQPILRGNGFTQENGYPTVSLGDGEALRAVVGAAAYLGVLAVFSLGVSAILRHTAGAITAVLVVVLGPVIATGLVPSHIGEVLEKYSLMGAGLSLQQTGSAPKEIPLEPAWGLAVVGAYGAAALVLALWSIGRRDA